MTCTFVSINSRDVTTSQVVLLSFDSAPSAYGAELQQSASPPARRRLAA